MNAVILRSTRKSSVQVATTLYKTLSLPLLEFSAPIWNPHLAKDVARIESVQRRFSRIVLGLNARRRKDSEPSYTARLATLGLYSLQSRRNFAVLKLLFKFIKNICFIELDRFCTFNERSEFSSLRIPFARCDAFFNSFFIASARAWNALPIPCRMADSFAVFLANLRKHVL